MSYVDGFPVASGVRARYVAAGTQTPLSTTKD